MDRIGDGLKKIILAGIGAAAATGEKSQEILADLVKKGELTVEQSKILNKELDLNDIKDKVKEKTVSMRDTVRGAGSRVKSEVDGKDIKEIAEMLKDLSKEQLGQIKSAVENFRKDIAEKEAAEEEAEEAEAAEEAECSEEAPEEETCDAAEELKDAAEEAVCDACEKTEDAAEDIQAALDDICEKADEAAAQASEKIDDLIEEIKAD